MQFMLYYVFLNKKYMQYKYICLLLKLIFLVAIVKNDAMQQIRISNRCSIFD